MSSMSNNYENKVADFLYRGQSYTPPATLWVGFLTAVASDSTAGTEVTGGSYARVGISADTTNMSGTQGAASTGVSTGTGGTISNNVEIVFPTPSADWGLVVGMAIWDASTGGNIRDYCALTSSKSIFSGDDVRIAVGQLQIQVDD